MKKTCTLTDIRAVFLFTETFSVDPSGVKRDIDMVPVKKVPPEFDGFLCVICDCKFHQWRAVMKHIGMEVE